MFDNHFGDLENKLNQDEQFEASLNALKYMDYKLKRNFLTSANLSGE